MYNIYVQKIILAIKKMIAGLLNLRWMDLWVSMLLLIFRNHVHCETRYTDKYTRAKYSEKGRLFRRQVTKTLTSQTPRPAAVRSTSLVSWVFSCSWFPDILTSLLNVLTGTIFAPFVYLSVQLSCRVVRVLLTFDAYRACPGVSS